MAGTAHALFSIPVLLMAITEYICATLTHSLRVIHFGAGSDTFCSVPVGRVRVRVGTWRTGPGLAIPRRSTKVYCSTGSALRSVPEGFVGVELVT